MIPSYPVFCSPASTWTAPPFIFSDLSGVASNFSVTKDISSISNDLNLSVSFLYFEESGFLSTVVL